MRVVVARSTSIVPSCCSAHDVAVEGADAELGDGHHGEADHREVEVAVSELGELRRGR